MMVNPIRGKINPAAVTAQPDPLFDHFFAVDLELYFAFRPGERGFLAILGFFFAGHVQNPFRPIGPVWIAEYLRPRKDAGAFLVKIPAPSVPWPGTCLNLAIFLGAPRKITIFWQLHCNYILAIK
jgi:hypothetical protein